MKKYHNEDGIIDAEELFQSSYNDAQKIMKDPDKIDKLLKDLERKLKKLPKLGATLSYIPKMALLIKSYIKGEYKNVPIATIFALVGAISYFVLPIDAIPDWIPGIGYLDDVGVVGGALFLVKGELDEYMNWRVSTGLDEAEVDDSRTVLAL